MASDQEALADFKKFLQKNKFKSIHLAVKLHFIICDWLAQPYHYDRFMDGLEVHRQVKRIEYIESSIRSGWTQKSASTRTAKQKTKKLADANARQLSFIL